MLASCVAAFTLSEFDGCLGSSRVRICVVFRVARCIYIWFRLVPNADSMLDALVTSASLESQSSSELEESCVALFIGERMYKERRRSA